MKFKSSLDYYDEFESKNTDKELTFEEFATPKEDHGLSFTTFNNFFVYFDAETKNWHTDAYQGIDYFIKFSEEHPDLLKETQEATKKIMELRSNIFEIKEFNENKNIPHLTEKETEWENSLKILHKAYIEMRKYVEYDYIIFQ